jgi:hypothetical protein
MIPITMKVLAGLIQLHGADSTVISDNKGIDELLGPVREQLQGNDFPVTLVDYPKASYGKSHLETLYKKAYTKDYLKWVGIQGQPAPSTTHSGAGSVGGGGGGSKKK